MSERHKPHNGRDRTGHFRVKHVAVDDLLDDPQGPDYLRDDVRLGGAVADTSASAGQHAEEITRMVEDDRLNVDHLVGRDQQPGKRKGR